MLGAATVGEKGVSRPVVGLHHLPWGVTRECEHQGFGALGGAHRADLDLT